MWSNSIKKSCNYTKHLPLKHHLTKMVNSGRNITNPRELAEAIEAASGIANVVVMLGSFSYEENSDFVQLKKITELNTIMFNPGCIKVWKAGQFGEGLLIPMNKIPFPSTFDFEFIGSSIPRRSERETLLYPKFDEKEVIEGDLDDCDDDADTCDDELPPPTSQESIYKCPEIHCDAEFITLRNFHKHLISKKCYKKTKKRTESVRGYVQRHYINMFNINQSVELTNSEKRYMHMSWDDQENSVSLLSTFSKSSDYHGKLFTKGFVFTTIRKKNAIHDDVRSFVREKYNEGEVTKRHMSYPKIVSEIEEALDNEGNPRFFPDKWLDKSQVAYLITTFMKEKKSKGAAVELSDEDIQEAISIDTAEENYVRKRDALQTTIETLQSEIPLSDQCHPIILEDNSNLCTIANDYYINEKTKESWIMQNNYSEILPILNAIDVQVEGRSKRKAGKAILDYVKTNCTCIPLRRKRNE